MNRENLEGSFFFVALPDPCAQVFESVNVLWSEPGKIKNISAIVWNSYATDMCCCVDGYTALLLHKTLTLSNTCTRGPGRATKKKLRCKFSLFIQWKITNHAPNILTFVSEQIAKTKILQNHVGPKYRAIWYVFWPGQLF